MIDWTQGGLTGSINRWANRDVREQLRKNPVARRARYPLAHRLLRAIFSSGSFARFLLLYCNLAVFTAILEYYSKTSLPAWPITYSGPATRLLGDVPGYLIGAQVGLLGVISLALALVSLIAQRDEGSIDVQVYYHESLFFGIVASSLALVLVLVGQLFWPLETLLRQVDAGAENPSFRLFFLLIHTAWFCLNVVAILHFIGITFRFVQRGAKQQLRERYTANVLLPQDMRARVRLALYRSLSEGLTGDGKLGKKAPLIAFGSAFSEPYDVEVSSYFKSPVQLNDVRARLVRWVLRRWCARCAEAAVDAPQTLISSPMMWFTPSLGGPLKKNQSWCRRRGGVPLSRLEQAVLRRAFRFTKVKDAI